jgi:hypothetical protein
MVASTYLAKLLQRHRLLEDELAEALQHPSVTDFTLAELKRRKLRLKDQIARLTHLEGRWERISARCLEFESAPHGAQAAESPPKPHALGLAAFNFPSGPAQWCRIKTQLTTIAANITKMAMSASCPPRRARCLRCQW